MILVRLEQWGGTRRDRPSVRLPVSKLFVHHTVTPQPINQEVEIRQLLQIDADHRLNGWGGIGYSFIIGPSGTVYEGQGQTIGAHTKGHNSSSLGVAFLGAFGQVLPTPAAMKAFHELCWHLEAVDALFPGFHLHGHRDAKATACPGDLLYAQLPSMRRLVAAGPEEEPVSDSIERVQSNAPITGIAPFTEEGTTTGYWLVGADGGVFSFGNAPFLGNVEFKLPFGAAWVPSAE